MKMKKNKSGKLQYYDSKGRYASNTSIIPTKIILTKREKKEKKEKERRELIYNKAIKSTDPLLFETYIAIEKSYPGLINDINFIKYNYIVEKNTEFDILAGRYIIEIKSGSAKKKLSQLLNQKMFATSINKEHLLYAKDIKYGTKIEYERNGIEVITDLRDLIKRIGDKK